MTESAIAAAIRFLKKYRLSQIDSTVLKKTIVQQGYTVIPFHHLCNEPEVETLVRALQLEQYIASSKGFTYANRDCRLVFLHDGLSEEEACMVLAHEQGHIFCGHTTTQPILGLDVQQEHEANEFAHYLLYPPCSLRLRRFLQRHKKLCILLAAVLTALVIGSVVLACVLKEQTYYGKYYLTETGSKYHIADCGYVSGKSNVRRMTKEDYDSGNYSPCEKCIKPEKAS